MNIFLSLKSTFLNEHWVIKLKDNNYALTDEGIGPNDVEGGNSEDLVGVVDSGGLEHLGGDGNRRVDGVGDDGDHRVGANLIKKDFVWHRLKTIHPIKINIRTLQRPYPLLVNSILIQISIA